MNGEDDGEIPAVIVHLELWHRRAVLFECGECGREPCVSALDEVQLLEEVANAPVAVDTRSDVSARDVGIGDAPIEPWGLVISIACGVMRTVMGSGIWYER